MKLFATAVLILITAIPGLAQTPQNIAASRWTLPGAPRITSVASTADGKANKTIWFTARDSSGIGTMTMPKGCVPATFTEYHPPTNNGFGPSQLAYAEKAFQVQDTAKTKPAKYKPQVWYVDGILPASNSAVTGSAGLYSLTPPAQKGGAYGWLYYQLPAIPVNVPFTVGIPYTLQWTAATKLQPSSLWFLGYNQFPTPATNLYSAAPQKKPTAAYGMVVTKYSFPTFNQNLTAARVEDGLIWTVGTDVAGGSTWLNMVPAGGTGNGLKWLIAPPQGNPVTMPQILPVYTTRKMGKGLMPNQVWIKGLQSLFVISLAASMDSTVSDTVYYMQGTNPIKLFNGLGADNKSKADTGKYVMAFTEGPPTGPGGWNINVSFLKMGAPVGVIQRHGISASTSSQVVSGIVVPNIASYSATVQPACLTGAPVSAISNPQFKAEWDFAYTGMFQNISAPFFTNVVPVGFMDTKKFDWVFAQAGGDQPVQNTPSDATISRFTGTFSKPVKAGTVADEELAAAPETDEELDASTVAEPTPYKLYDSYPNPFNPSTIIQFSLAADSRLSIAVFNTLGQQVATLVDGLRQAGLQSVEWNAANLPSGVYFYRIDATALGDASQHFSETRRMLLVK